MTTKKHNMAGVLNGIFGLGCLFISSISFSGQHNFTYKEIPKNSPLQSTVFHKVGMEKGIDPRLLYAISLVESNKNAGKKLIKPDPYVLRAPTKIYRGDDKNDSCDRLQIYANDYKNMVDVGLMQVNLRWNGHRVSDKCDLLEPEKNVSVAAQILKEEISRGGIYSIGRYHNPTDALAKKYQESVLYILNNLLKEGF